MQASSFIQPSGSGQSELVDLVCIDPLAPRQKPRYTYNMPSSSSNSNHSDEDYNYPEESSYPEEPSYPECPPQTPPPPATHEHSDAEKRYYSGSCYEQPYVEPAREPEMKRVRFSNYRRGSSLERDSYHRHHESSGRSHKRDFGHMTAVPIAEEVIEDMRRCLEGLRQTLDRGRRHASTGRIFDWNCKVKKFLEGNLAHALRFNSYFRKRRH